jgi:hypothetical protein
MSRKKSLAIGKVLGDVNAVARGTIVQRILHRLMGSWASRAMSVVLHGWRR